LKKKKRLVVIVKKRGKRGVEFKERIKSNLERGDDQ